jgi:N-acetylmuramoyl-L-alanine amidase
VLTDITGIPGRTVRISCSPDHRYRADERRTRVREPVDAGLRRATSARARVVVLDPGHNGGNAGALRRSTARFPTVAGNQGVQTTGTSTDAGYAEHAFTFDVAQRVAQRLTARGVHVVLTRTDDHGVGPCVDERGRAGDQAGADAVVSIHADGAAASGKGFHVAYSDPPSTPLNAGRPARWRPICATA